MILTPKHLGDTVTVVFDYISQLGPTETISSVVGSAMTCTVWSGVDPTPSAVISGTATISGTKILQNITGGVVGTIYALKCIITTSLGQTIQMGAYQAVITDLP